MGVARWVVVRSYYDDDDDDDDDDDYYYDYDVTTTTIILCPRNEHTLLINVECTLIFECVICIGSYSCT